ncbi:restriction endonuclease subunit S [Acinetobacter guillouiae]|uniref:Type I restriction modification DNA specificity domain-containing protein n=1 Tax=Acinetobacter guillouiae NIPH 991 TaxID=1217656 RepID=N8X0N6_ACIGI|nr:restriction endonuclease subunit S [Acinetobacter guillouiae]ENV17821.1 hypothetical protein F964_01126 [Acinetobacter guillouiae NIPH 991]
MIAPKLRFKEFDGEWINIKVKDLGEFSSGGTPSKDIQNYWNGSIPWISSSDLNEESIFDIHISRFISEDAIKNSAAKKIPKNSVLLVSRVGVGKVALTNQELCTSQDFTALTPKKDDALFIAYLMKNLTPRLLDLNQGTSIKGFVREDLISLFINLPSKDEQTQIAFFLSQVDEKICQLTKKNKLLNRYKQGMIQKLFSQQIRFKADDGSKFGEWKETTLGQTGKFIGGGTPSKENNAFWEGSIPWISSSDLTEESIFKINITRYISSDGLNQSATKLVPANSILIVSRVGVGKVAITPHEICTSQDFTSLALTDGNSIFFAYLIKSLTPYLLEMNQGTSIKGFVKEDLSNLEISVPCLDEQTKIANFLSAIDQKIEITTQQIEQAKQWKKGLLQQMFV